MQPLMIYPLGETALVLQTDISAQPRLIAMVRAFETRQTGQALYQLILGVGNLTVRFNPLQQSAEVALSWLQQQWELAANQLDAFAPTCVEIPVQYGGEAGPDLAYVAEQAGMTPQQVIEAHAGASYDVLCIGFLPGFPYLAGLPASIATPRRAEPRLSVPAGAVGIGGAQTGIYPCASPGGWQLIGRTDFVLFDRHASQPCRLRAGDRVRFVPQERT
jgi:KipI family sensor histidine kinase inhibitor